MMDRQMVNPGKSTEILGGSRPMLKQETTAKLGMCDERK